MNQGPDILQPKTWTTWTVFTTWHWVVGALIPCLESQNVELNAHQVSLLWSVMPRTFHFQQSLICGP